MYERILLAYDGSLEGRTALREGALLAKLCQAKVFLLSVVAESAGMMMAEGAYTGAMVHEQTVYRSVLEEGVLRLKDFGLDASARLVTGEPAHQIGAYAKEIKADLVVVGHRKPKFLERWWSGSLGATLMDCTKCTLLIARSAPDDDAVQPILDRIAHIHGQGATPLSEG